MFKFQVGNFGYFLRKIELEANYVGDFSLDMVATYEGPKMNDNFDAKRCARSIYNDIQSTDDDKKYVFCRVQNAQSTLFHLLNMIDFATIASKSI